MSQCVCVCGWVGCGCVEDAYGLYLCLGAHAQASEVYGSVCVCVCVCVCRLLQLLKDQQSASKSFYRLLVMFSWI